MNTPRCTLTLSPAIAVQPVPPPARGRVSRVVLSALPHCGAAAGRAVGAPARGGAWQDPMHQSGGIGTAGRAATLPHAARQKPMHQRGQRPSARPVRHAARKEFLTQMSSRCTRMHADRLAAGMRVWRHPPKAKPAKPYRSPPPRSHSRTSAAYLRFNSCFATRRTPPPVDPLARAWQNPMHQCGNVRIPQHALSSPRKRNETMMRRRTHEHQCRHDQRGHSSRRRAVSPRARPSRATRNETVVRQARTTPPHCASSWCRGLNVRRTTARPVETA
jgi:hypothetical protein